MVPPSLNHLPLSNYQEKTSSLSIEESIYWVVDTKGKQIRNQDHWFVGIIVYIDLKCRHVHLINVDQALRPQQIIQT